MSRKVGIIVSLVLALVFALLIVNAANRKYNEMAQKVQVAQAADYIPAGSEINESSLKAVEVPKYIAGGLATVQEAAGKTAKVSMVKGQYVYKEALDTAGALRPGYVEVFVPVDLSSSAYALAGQTVNVHIVNKDSKTAPLVLENVRVLHCLDNQGGDVGSGGNALTEAAARKNEPASVGIEVPKDKAEMVVYAAKENMVYLTRAKGGT